ncbi:MAG: RimK family alpha-L-glutamate ligase [Lewinella sp.]|nr:RimK family alpha-L-glutamate ligase [Lewinella sp.]
MRIGVLSRSTQLYSTQSLYRAGRRRGHQVYVIDHTYCNLILDNDRPAIEYKGKLLDNLDAIIPRIGASVTGLGAAVINQFELMEVPTPTGSEALLRARDKLRCLQLLAQHGLPVPKTVMISGANNLYNAARLIGDLPIVVKLLESTHGTGVELADSYYALVTFVETFQQFDDRILLQEYIAEAAGADIRALVVDGEIVATMRRQAQAGEFRSNLHRGATAKPYALSPEESELVKAVVNALQLEVAGVDLLPSDRGPLIMEVNASPGLEGIESTTGVDVAGHIIRLVERKVKQKRQAKNEEPK